MLYAPPTAAGLSIMKGILEELGLSGHWRLVPMLDRSLIASDLGEQLSAATANVRSRSKGPIIFLGMDSPVLTREEIVRAT